MIFCGVAIALSFQADQFNLGAEGSFIIAAAVGTAFAVSTSMPVWLHIPLVLIVAAATGAAWSLIPGILKAKWNASELVSSLMMNYVAFYFSLYLINSHFRDLDGRLPCFAQASSDRQSSPSLFRGRGCISV